jgi:hypothetical protein
MIRKIQCLDHKSLSLVEVSGKNCYLLHEERTDDTDDFLLDAANQLALTEQDLHRWITGKAGFSFMEEWSGLEPSSIDFVRHLSETFNIKESA